MYAVYRDDKRVSKFYENRLAAVIDALEQGFVVNCGRLGKCLMDGVKIKKLENGLINNDALEFAMQYGTGA